MKLYQITEPADDALHHQDASPHTFAVGIDLGTTNSLVAVMQDGDPIVIKDNASNSYTPSVVEYSNNRVIVGNEANPEQSLRSAKRLLNIRKEEDIAAYLPAIAPTKSGIAIQIQNADAAIVLQNGKSISVTEALSEILKKLKHDAEAFLKQSVQDAVITVPAYFDEAARDATKKAAYIAGLNVLRLVNEPTAAAIAYGFHNQKKGIYAVYDLGGGTFDISILKMQEGVLQVLAIAGDHALGGDDFDAAILNFIIIKFDDIAYNSFNLIAARKLKEDLSQANTASCNFISNSKEYKEIQLSSAEINQLLLPYINKTIALFKAALQDAKIVIDDVNEIILVGGSSKMPIIQALLEEMISADGASTTIHSNINPDQVVAIGAAIQADRLSSGSNQLLIDVIPLSIGIELADGTVEKIIYKNTNLPVAKSMVYTNQADWQTAFVIHIVQGEADMANQCRSIVRFNIPITPSPRAQNRVEVILQVDADGLLSATAKDLITGLKQEVIANPSYGLDDEEIERLVLHRKIISSTDTLSIDTR